MGAVILRQLRDSVGFGGVFWQPTIPQVGDQRPILRHVGESMQGQMPFASGAEPGSCVHLRSFSASGTVGMVAIFTPVAEDHHLLTVGSFTKLTGSVIAGLARSGHHGGSGTPWLVGGGSGDIVGISKIGGGGSSGGG